MQTPMPTMSSEHLLLLGRFHLAALDQHAETRGLVAGFQPTQDALAGKLRTREDAQNALVGPRVAMRFAEYLAEQVIRAIALAAHAADNNMETGAAFRAVFPEGVDAEVRPRGAAQVRTARRVRDRLAAAPAAAPFRDAHLAPLDGAIADLDAKIEARGVAGRTLGVARAEEDAARETFVAGYDSNAGAIRTLFPRNRARQDLYFDEFRTRGPLPEETDEPPPATAPPPTVPPSA